MTYVSNQSVGESVTNLADADDGAVTIGRGTRVQAVFGVGGSVEGLEVVRVGAELVDLVEEILLEEELANVLNLALGEAGTVGDVGLDRDVDVRGSGDVVAGEECQELNHALVVGDLDSAQEGIVVCRAIVASRHAVVERGRVGVDAGEARVGAGSVAVPDRQSRLGQRLASLDVNDTNVEVKVETLPK